MSFLQIPVPRSPQSLCASVVGLSECQYAVGLLLGTNSSVVKHGNIKKIIIKKAAFPSALQHTVLTC